MTRTRGEGSWFGRIARRRLQLVLYAALIFVAIVLTAVFAVAVVPKSGLSTSDKLSALNDTLAGGGLLLGLVAGLIALDAHATSTGQPEVKFQVWIGKSPPNQLILASYMDDDGRLRSRSNSDQERLRIRVMNKSAYSAEEVVVFVEFRGVAFDGEFGADLGGWLVVDAGASSGGAVAAELSGQYALHGGTTRRLPDLMIGSLTRLRPNDGELRILLASKGYLRRLQPIPILFIDGGRVEDTPNQPPNDGWI